MRMTKLARTLAFSLLAATIAHTAQAADTALYNGPLPPAMVKAKESGSIDILKTFQAEGGLKGWLVKDKANNRFVTLFTTADGNVMLAGLAMSKDGKNLTAEYTDKYAPAQDFTPAYKAFSSDAAGITVGKSSAKAEITVVFDPNCGYCRLLSKMLKPAIDSGALKVRYVPVAILGNDSMPKAAGFLASKNPSGYIAAEIAGERVDTSTDATLTAKVTANTGLMRKHSLNGTPVVLYKSGKGNSETLNVASGVPDMAAMYAKLGLQAEYSKLKADPALSSYLK